MRKLLAAVTAAVSFCVTGSLSAAGGLAAADEPAPDGPVTAAAEHSGTPGRGYALGGAHVLGIPYDEYIRRTGADWFPGLDRQIVDYPAGQVQAPLNGDDPVDVAHVALAQVVLDVAADGVEFGCQGVDVGVVQMSEDLDVGNSHQMSTTQSPLGALTQA